jgi:TusA-related sulfurtransferase
MSAEAAEAVCPEPDRRLDITHLVCPMTYVRTKLCLEEMAVGEALALRIRYGESYNNVTRSVRDEGHSLLGERPESEEIVQLIIRKERD